MCDNTHNRKVSNKKREREASSRADPGAHNGQATPEKPFKVRVQAFAQKKLKVILE